MEILLPILEKNPNKHVLPERIEMSGGTDEATELRYGVLWARLQPPGPLSLYLWATQPEYRGGNEAFRRTTLNETTVRFQEKVQHDAQRHRIPKVRMSDAFGLSVEYASDDVLEALEYAIHVHGNVQWIRMNENEKRITCIPADLRKWTTTQPILWVRERYRSAGEWSAPSALTLRTLSNWISDREHDGWKLDYPVAEGTLVQLKAEWKSLGHSELPPTQSGSGKPLKDDYARAVGHLQAIRHLLGTATNEEAADEN